MITINELLKLDRRCRLLIQCPAGTREVSTLDLADALEEKDYDRMIPTRSFDFPDLDADISKPKLGTIKAKAKPDILDIQPGVPARTPSGLYLPSTDIIRLPNVIGDSFDIRMPSPSDFAHPYSLTGLDDYDRVIVTNDLGKPGKYQAVITTVLPSGSPLQSTLMTESIGKSSLSKGFSTGLKGQGLYLAVDVANSVYQAWLDGKIQTIADVASELQKYVEKIPESYLRLAEEIVVSAITNNADRLLPALAELTPIPLAARVGDSLVETIEKVTDLDAGLYPSQQLDLVYDFILDRPTGVKIGGSLENGTVTVTESFGQSPDRITTYSAKDAASNNLVSSGDWIDVITNGSIISDSSTGNESTNPIAVVVNEVSSVVQDFTDPIVDVVDDFASPVIDPIVNFAGNISTHTPNVMGNVSSFIQDVVTSPYSTPYGAINEVTGGAVDRALDPIRSFVWSIFD